MQLRWAFGSDTGLVRDNNEDFAGLWNLHTGEKLAEEGQTELVGRGLLALVCDGMGGANAGEVASEMAAESIMRTLVARLQIGLPRNHDRCTQMLSEAISGAHEEVLRDSIKNPGRSGMGSTVTALWITPDIAFAGQVGDSRLYELYQGQIARVTHDHSPVGEMLRNGEIDEEEARLHPQRHLINQVVGGGMSNVYPETFHVTHKPGARLLLCSDGLNDAVPGQQIHTQLGSKQPLSTITTELITAANAAGGHDNISVVTLEFIAD